MDLRGRVACVNGKMGDEVADPPALRKLPRSAVVEKLVETTSAAAGYRSAARRFEMDRDSADARHWDALRHHMALRKTRSIAWGVEQDTRAAIDHWAPDEIAAWKPPPPPASRRDSSRRRDSSPTGNIRLAAEPPLAAAASVSLAIARETSAHRDMIQMEARTAEAEAEVARLRAELSACQHELSRNQQLAHELGVAMRCHQADMTTHHRQKTALAIKGEVRELRRAHQRLRLGAVQDIATMHGWLSEQLDGLQQLVGQSASLAATERWFLQKSLQSHLDTVTQEIKSQVSADFRRYVQPPSSTTPPHPPWTQAARGIRSRGTPYPSKTAVRHPTQILDELSDGSRDWGTGSMAYRQSLSSRTG